MNVSSILRRKGTQVQKALPQMCILEAANRITTQGIGSLVVTDKAGNPVGVLSETDLVRAFAQHGDAFSRLYVGEMASARPATCKPDDSVREIMSIMTQRRTRHLPVMAGDAMVGIVSIGDVVKGLVEELELEVGILRDYARVRR